VTDTATRVGGPGDRNLFIELWGEFLREHHKHGNFVEPTVHSMDYYNMLFEKYTSGEAEGVVVFAVPGHAVCMWGDVGVNGMYDHTEGRVAHSLGSYVRPEYRSRHHNIPYAMWKRACKVLKKRGFNTVISSVNVEAKDVNIEGHIGIKRATEFGFEPVQVTGFLRL